MRDAISKLWRSVRGEAPQHAETWHAGRQTETAPATVREMPSIETDPLDPDTVIAETAPTPALTMHDEKPARHELDLRSSLVEAEQLRNAGQSKQADAVLNECLAHHPMNAETAVGLALNAQAAEEWDEALLRWRAGRAHYPDAPIFVASEIAVLHILGRLDEAATLSEEAVAVFPDTIDVGAQRLSVLLSLQDWQEAERELDRLSAHFPAHPYLRDNGVRIEEKIREGLRGSPQDAVLADALEADRTQDWPAALRCWSTLHDRNPNDLTYIVRLGNTLTRIGRFDEADQVLKAGCEALPDNIEVAANYAQVAASRADWPEAARRWAHILDRHPNSELFWVMAASAYREAGRYDEADRLLRRAIEAEPDRIELRVHHAVLSDKQEDWATSVKRWDIAHRMQPDEPNIRNSRGDAIWQEAASRLEGKTRGEAPAQGDAEPAGNTLPMAAVDEEAAQWKQLALQFEGLGDHCEFGIVQRRLGADPIGLFRFAAISAAAITSLIRESFERLGDPEFTELGITGGDEYLVRDKRGLYHMHCFVRQGSVDEPKFLSQQITRLRYLKQKLISDLSDGQKTFVYKSSLERISDDVARDLHAALESFGPNTLLVIRQSEPAHEAGTVSVLEDRILVGYLQTPYGGDAQPIDFDSWRSILKAAMSHRQRLASEIEQPRNHTASGAG